jgi:lysophospholipase L1-like esterase
MNQQRELLRKGGQPFLVAATLLCVCGALLRAEKPPDFAHWEKAIAAFEKQDRAKPPPKDAILFVGSSSIRLWDLPRSFPDRQVINRGFGGSEIADSVHFAPRILLKYRPRLIVFYAGDNDIAAGRRPERVAADFKEFVRTVHAELPRTKILFLSIKPSIRRWNLVERMRRANELIRDYCKQVKRVEYVDVATPMLGTDGKPRRELFQRDGLHLNAAGYKLWASIVKPLLG